MKHTRRTTRTITATHRAARNTSRPLSYWTLSGKIAADVAAGRLVRVRDFLARIGGDTLPDGKQSWFGRHAKKAYIAANGRPPLMVWTQHRTTGKWIHVYVYGAIDLALYEALRTYKGTRDLLASGYARCA